MPKSLLKLLLFLTYLLIVWGAVVRGTGSGLGCPDWPLCHGQIIPPFEQAVLIEYAHRLLASLVGILTLVFCVRVWINADLRKIFGKKCGLLLGLLIFQIILGGIAVKTELHPHIVAIHLGAALLFLGVIFYLFLQVRSPQSVVRSPGLLSHWRLAVVFLQILLGGLVAASEAGLACPDFPTCQGVWLPDLRGNVALHFSHRVLAFIILGMASYLAIKKWQCPLVKTIFGLVVLQILLGIGTVLMGLPLWMRIAHNGVAVLLFLGLVVRSYELRRG
ncbi:MAG: COX15/CtaA family protein [Deltaproteobacteria bacterium]|nr:COX15/CtaA family protein [Deltaproteobacteria bacterium]